jgi:SAM-dependent methyltransferase
MFSASAEFYDLLYSGLNDYASETAAIASLIRARHPTCRTVLDVGCGTGEHACRLTTLGFHVDGIDLDPGFVAIARRKCASGEFVEADMTDFDLHRQYDAVLCLFSSIGYARTLEGVGKALGCFRAHLAPDGVMLVEPWFTPGRLDTTRVDVNTAAAGGVRVTRTSRIDIDGRISRLFFDYDVTDASGTRRLHEVHELGLFTTKEMLRVFHEAGLSVEHDSKGLMDRGLYIAKRAA